LNCVGRGGSVSTRHFRGHKTACDRALKLAIGLNSRSAIRNWRGITNRISGAAGIAKRASDQNGGIGSSARLEPSAFRHRPWRNGTDWLAQEAEGAGGLIFST